MTDDLPARSRLVASSLEAAGIPGKIIVLPMPRRRRPWPPRPSASRCGAIANSLVFWSDDEPLLVMTSGAHRVDTAAGRPARARGHPAGDAGTGARRDGQPIGGRRADDTPLRCPPWSMKTSRPSPRSGRGRDAAHGVPVDVRRARTADGRDGDAGRLTACASASRPGSGRDRAVGADDSRPEQGDAPRTVRRPSRGRKKGPGGDARERRRPAGHAWGGEGVRAVAHDGGRGRPRLRTARRGIRVGTEECVRGSPLCSSGTR